jgi:uncharacterized protein YceK
MHWVLIVVVVYIGGSSSITSQKIDFDTQSACKAAAAQITKDLGGTWNMNSVRTSCVQTDFH